MDKTLELKLKKLNQALARLKESKEEFGKVENDFLRDSVIKRFEFCFDLIWKTAKYFLKKYHGDDISSPKSCFRALAKNNIVSDEEAVILLDMVDDRNDIIHNYEEQFSKEILVRINKKYFNLMQKTYKEICRKIKENESI